MALRSFCTRARPPNLSNLGIPAATFKTGYGGRNRPPHLRMAETRTHAGAPAGVPRLSMETPLRREVSVCVNHDVTVIGHEDANRAACPGRYERGVCSWQPFEVIQCGDCRHG